MSRQSGIIPDYVKVDYINLLVFECCFSPATPPALQDWTRMAETFDNLTDSVSVITNRCNPFPWIFLFSSGKL